MPNIRRSCAPFSFLDLKAIFTRKSKSKSPDEERQYALFSDPESGSDSDSQEPTITYKHLENVQQPQGQDISAQVRLADEYPRIQEPPKTKTKTKTVAVKECYVGFGIGGAGNMRRLVWIITRACIAFACAAVRFEMC